LIKGLTVPSSNGPSSQVKQPSPEEGDLAQLPKQIPDVEKKVSELLKPMFADLSCDPQKAVVNFTSRPNDRYVFARSKSFSVELAGFFRQIFGPTNHEFASRVGYHFVFELGHRLGKADATDTMPQLQLKSIPETFYTLPICLANTGWGKMSISSASVFSSKPEQFFMQFTVQDGAEVAGWRSLLLHSVETPSKKPEPKKPSCLLTAGYCLGWASAVLQREDLYCLEVTCKAIITTDECVFVLATRDRVEQLGRTALGPDRASELENSTGLKILSDKIDAEKSGKPLLCSLCKK
jgi:hypothetical protein